MSVFGKFIVGILPLAPKFVVKRIAGRYVAGSDIQSAVTLMKKMDKENTSFTIDVLGEEIKNLDEARFFVEEYSRVLDAINLNGIDANISLKPTAFGLLLDKNIAIQNIEEILNKAAINDIFVRLDMEDHRVTQATIDIVLLMQERGFENIGTVLQGRLFRTEEDIKQISKSLGPLSDFRICKGIYLEPTEISHTNYQDIVKATNSCIDLLLESGSYTAIASHDYPIIKHSLEKLENMHMSPDNDPRTDSGELRDGKGSGYEFQFLLGVRGDLRRQLASQGHLTRVYVPYGNKWYEYGVRRIRENPDIAWHVTKTLLMPWTNRR
ncbi:MAG: proline dehydrogenase family protein [Candidatus Poseidoniales archaeon]|nr:proline dehydrogenase family protein [Candidatus Poseidoniales archaeon]